MTPSEQDAAMVRLAVQVEHLTTAVQALTADMGKVRQQIDEARGGASVLRWLAGGSLAAFLGLCLTLYAWARGL